ncbi:MAG: hypothetical protein NVS4B8_07320 [Herpetosiphon sp.]
MPFTFRSPARISGWEFRQVLERYGSPVVTLADECYQIIVAAGLDPAVALAFFGHESVFGTQGTAVRTKNWGNVRTAFDPRRSAGQDPANFVIFHSWQDGLRDWCDRINVRYIKERHLLTPEAALPVYAPSSDGNDVQSYIDHVNRLVQQWIAEDHPPPDEDLLSLLIDDLAQRGLPLPTKRK